MMKPLPLVASLCVAGLLAGMAGKRVCTATSSGADREAETSSRSGPGAAGANPAGEDKLSKPAMTHVRSTDTVASLLAIPNKALYPRLALWMTDAGEQDIGAFWEGFRGRADYDHNLIDLVFFTWTRLNLRGAIAATKGGDYESYAWRAWACHDPKAALVAVLVENPECTWDVTHSIGEFHPRWLREHFNELPEANRQDALVGISDSGNSDDQLELLEFARKNGEGISYGGLEILARRDPWAALGWLKEIQTNGLDNELLNTVVRTISECSPEILPSLIARMPSGEVKSALQRAEFEKLVLKDTAAALNIAQTAPPRIAAERYAAIGESMLGSNPEGAFQMAQKLLAACPEALHPEDIVRTPDGDQTMGVNLAGVDDFMKTLMARDPGRTLLMLAPLQGKAWDGNTPFEEFAVQWEKEDFTGYRQWLNSQQDQVVRDRGVVSLAKSLCDEGHFEEAADWAETLHGDPGGPFKDVVQEWYRAEPAEAMRWLDSLDLPDQEKQRMREAIDPPDPFK